MSNFRFHLYKFVYPYDGRVVYNLLDMETYNNTGFLDIKTVNNKFSKKGVRFYKGRCYNENRTSDFSNLSSIQEYKSNLEKVWFRATSRYELIIETDSVPLMRDTIKTLIVVNELEK